MRRTSFLALFVLTLLLCQTYPASASDPDWIEVKSEHFRVITDAGEKKGRQVADRFEEMRSAFALMFRRKTLNEPVPLTIIAFRNTREIRQYSPIFQGKVVELAGFFVPGGDENFVAIDMSREGSWETVRHEYAHDLLNANYPETAPWFDEGFAEFLSSLTLTEKEAQLGAPIPEAATLAQGKKLGLLELFEVQHHSETYNKSGQRREMFYVQSWLVVHYLFDTDQTGKASRYFTLINAQRVPVPEAVQTAFGMSVTEMDKAVLDYLRGNKVKIRLFDLKNQMAVSKDTTVRALSPLEARAELADLHLHSPEYGQVAVKEFEAIVAEDASQTNAQRGLGYAYVRQNDYAKAAEHLGAAARLGSRDPKVYFYTAVMLQQKDPMAMTSPVLVSNLRRAVELDPQYADAYAMLGTSLLNSGSYAEAEADLARAVALQPRNDLYRLNYGIALCNQQKFDEGKASLSMVENSSNPEIARQAQQMIESLKKADGRRMEVMGSDGPPPAASQGDAARSLRITSEEPPESRSAAERASTDTPTAPAAPVKISFLQGKLISVDCSESRSAILNVSSGGKTYKLKVADRDTVILIGRDSFSCGWTQMKVALNYTPTAADEGRVVSLELQ